jgi:FixJ family two-component response regulator
VSADAAPVVVHVVDDDEAMRVALLRLFGAAGYAPRGYGSAGEFLIGVVDAPTGVLVLDLHMPGPDGLALYDSLRRRGIDLPTVFLTGRGDIPSSVRAEGRGQRLPHQAGPKRRAAWRSARRARRRCAAPRRA